MYSKGWRSQFINNKSSSEADFSSCGKYWGDRDLPRWLNVWKDGKFLSVSHDLLSKSTAARISLKSPAMYITEYMTKKRLMIPWVNIWNIRCSFNVNFFFFSFNSYRRWITRFYSRLWVKSQTPALLCANTIDLGIIEIKIMINGVSNCFTVFRRSMEIWVLFIK